MTAGARAGGVIALPRESVRRSGDLPCARSRLYF
jgi:hypothetical protein